MKRWLKRVLPNPHAVREHRSIGVFGNLLKDPNLWHLNRRSVAGGVGLGLFLVFLPMFGQMLYAGALAIWLRVNLPIAVALTWISNPLTFAPIFYFCFMVGCWLSGRPIPPFDPDFWLDWHNWLAVYLEVLLGCAVVGSVSSAAGYFGTQALWRANLRRQIARRRERIAQARQGPVAGGALPEAGLGAAAGIATGVALDSSGAAASRPSSSRQT